MKQEIFRGIATALATPMELDGAIDYEAYGRLIDWQIDAGVAGLVACGTTGESATMTEAEHKEVIRFTVERAAGRVCEGSRLGIAPTGQSEAHLPQPVQALPARGCTGRPPKGRSSSFFASERGGAFGSVSLSRMTRPNCASLRASSSSGRPAAMAGTMLC